MCDAPSRWPTSCTVAIVFESVRKGLVFTTAYARLGELAQVVSAMPARYPPTSSGVTMATDP